MKFIKKLSEFLEVSNKKYYGLINFRISCGQLANTFAPTPSS